MIQAPRGHTPSQAAGVSTSRVTALAGSSHDRYSEVLLTVIHVIQRRRKLQAQKNNKYFHVSKYLLKYKSYFTSLV